MTNKKNNANAGRWAASVLIFILAFTLLFVYMASPVMAADTDGLVKSQEGWVYMKGGKVDNSFSGLVKNANGWWKVTKGKVDFSYTGLAKNEKGWWYVRRGKIDFNYTGFAENANGWWYVKNGRVAQTTTGVFKGKVKGENAWWYVKNGRVRFVDTVAKNENGWWKITSGKVDFSYTGLAKNENGWWKIRNGKVDFTYNGLTKNENGWWKVEKGKVNFNYNDFAENSKGWWYLKGGKVRMDASGIYSGTVSSSAGKYYVKNGKYVDKFTGLAKSGNDYYYVENGKQTTYTGPSQSTANDDKWYHVINGKWNRDYTGEYSDKDNSYYVVKGGISTSVFTYNGDKRYVGSDNKVKTGIVETDTYDLYYSRESNKLVKTDEGFFTYNGNDYYANAGGKLARNGSVKYNGTTYIAGSNGILQKADKVIYLTFDDGPGPYTDKLISILDKYGAKATFFINGNNGASSYYLDCIGRAYRSGHSIGNHTYTHDWASCYSSAYGFWSEFDRNNEVIKAQTGSYTNLLRFPGGSSNTISARYSSGIMTTLTAQCGAKSVVYFDWTVDSRDAGGVNTSSAVYSNIVNGVSGRNNCVVLCHDVKSYTVNAIEDVIIWGQSNGYVFLPLTETSPTAHHGVNN